jgi:hypothetical protein
VRPGPFVSLELAGRDDLCVEQTGLPRRHRPLVAAQRERVLVLAADVVLVDEVLGRLPHRERRVQLGELRVDEPPPEGRVDQLGHPAGRQRLRLGERPGRARHRLDAPRDDQVALPDHDGARSLDHRLQSRSAQAVDGHSRDGDGQAGQQRAHARDVAVVLPGLVRATGHHLVDVNAVDTGPLHQRPDDAGQQIVGPHPPQSPADLADRRPDSVDEKRLGHAGHHLV